jgi:hypothetical protein
MLTKEISSGQWLYKEGTVHRDYFHKLLKGKVSVYESDQMIGSIEVQEGQKPRLLGVLSVLSGEHDPVNDAHKHTASVTTNTDITCETIEIGPLKHSLRQELDEDKRSEVDAIVKAIIMSDKIKLLQRRISQLPLPEKFEFPENISPEISEVLHELQELYDGTS